MLDPNHEFSALVLMFHYSASYAEKMHKSTKPTTNTSG